MIWGLTKPWSVGLSYLRCPGALPAPGWGFWGTQDPSPGPPAASKHVTAVCFGCLEKLPQDLGVLLIHAGRWRGGCPQGGPGVKLPPFTASSIFSQLRCLPWRSQPPDEKGDKHKARLGWEGQMQKS